MLLVLIVLLLLGWIVLDRQLNNGSIEPDHTVWTTFIGRDTTVGILPDQYANYYTYTVARTRKDVGFRIKGQYPHARYFSFNVYSLGDNTTQGSIVDYQINPDEGMSNPFIEVEGNQENSYSIHLLPDHLSDLQYANSLPFDNDTRLLTIVMRLYDYDIDDKGGVDLPTVQAFTIHDDKRSELSPTNLPRPLDLRSIVRRRSLPKMVERLSVLYNTENTIQLEGVHDQSSYPSISFHAIDTKGFIENNDNRYLLAGITREEDEVYLFRLKPPTHTTGPSDINQTDVRYWSFNLGNAASYNFNALKDEDAIIAKDGFVYIVLGTPDDQELQDIAHQKDWNYLAWNMPWKKGLILFRHMLAHPNFEAQIEDVPAIDPDMDDYTFSEARRYMGDYAPHGQRMSRSEFINEYQQTKKGLTQ